jgi:hypothetical protein
MGREGGERNVRRETRTQKKREGESERETVDRGVSECELGEMDEEEDESVHCHG